MVGSQEPGTLILFHDQIDLVLEPEAKEQNVHLGDRNYELELAGAS